MSVPSSSTLPVAFGAAVVKHVPVSNGNGTVQGSVRQLNGESVILNGGAVVTGNLFVPGSPTVTINGQSTFGGVVQGSGNSSQANYSVIINGTAQLGHLVVRTDPVTLAAVPTPPTPTGTRDVTINAS